MEFEIYNIVFLLPKLPLIKWVSLSRGVLRIKLLSIHIQDYALWEVIENGNSWVSVPQTAQENGTSVTKMSVPVTAEEKTNKKNDVNARSLLLMALPNEHQLTFSMHQAQSLLTLFSTSSRDVDNRLAIGCAHLSRKTLNSNFLSSLPPEWNTHVVVWMNKPSIDDLYNNFKIVEQKVKKYVGASSGAQNLAFMIAPKLCYLKVSTASFSDNVVYAFMFENPNGSNLLHQYLEQIEAIDLKWQLSLLSMRAKRELKHQRQQEGFDWSDMAEEQVQTNMALIAFSNSENEVLFSEEVTVLNREVACKDYEINVLKSEFEKVNQEKEGIEFKIEKFDNALKCLDKLLGSQITDKNKKGLGYNVVPLPHPLIYNRPKKLDLSYFGLDEFKDPEFKSYCSEDKQVSEDTSSFVESSLNVDKETIFLVDKKIEFSKSKNHEKPVKSQLAQSTVRRPYQSKTVLSNKRFTQINNTAKAKAVNTARLKAVNTVRPHSAVVNVVKVNQANAGKPQQDDTGFVDSGCSRHMTGNIAYLSDFKEFDGGYVTFGGGAHGGRISGKGTLKTDSLDFEDVYFVNELKFNLFSVSHMCDKKNYVLFTNTECLVLSPNFKLPDESQILLKIPRKDNMYSFDMKNIIPKETLTCLVAKATSDESMLWHRRLGHINFKNINKLVKDNLVRGLPTKRFENDQTCVACLKGKQHRVSCKFKVLNPITKPLFMLHMDLFCPTFVSSLMHKKYCLVVTDDYSRFTWVFFLTTKDETSEIHKNFIKEIENLVDKKVKIIRCGNGTEFKNKVMDDFCREKGIRREYSVARTP
ncbi:putative ribonuclease H-like domain-containing protein [Tanacetum coccineum]|uniref:Ribonuclease H-like domain-containing protein n=1 Tax=Tanacetum coccineum TaxID=301880 RepID=A0ABQ4YW98_9ASTR